MARSRWLHTQETATFIFVRVTMVYSDDRLIEVFHLSLSHWNVFTLFQVMFLGVIYYFWGQASKKRLWKKGKNNLAKRCLNLDEITLRSHRWFKAHFSPCLQRWGRILKITFVWCLSFVKLCLSRAFLGGTAAKNNARALGQKVCFLCVFLK